MNYRDKNKSAGVTARLLMSTFLKMWARESLAPIARMAPGGKSRKLLSSVPHAVLGLKEIFISALIASAIFIRDPNTTALGGKIGG